MLNKFSAFSPDGEIIKTKTGFKQHIKGVGLHEVIIETPEHNMTTALLPVAHIKQILLAYKPLSTTKNNQKPRCY
ncbi:MAG: hypothetical protein NT178_07190 [Proteobacteria bacterium]|nr:hypothetical protein [Pseudomonadota bacterium]